jgi:hypothetical protein
MESKELKGIIEEDLDWEYTIIIDFQHLTQFIIERVYNKVFNIGSKWAYESGGPREV